MDHSDNVMKPIHLTCFLFVICTILSGCASSGATSTPIRTETQPPSRTPIVQTRQSTYTPMPRPTWTPTLTPPDTLEPEQAEDAIRTLLQEPVDCEAPCFWGIAPGKTTLGEAKNIFARLGHNLRFTIEEGGNKFYSGIYQLDDTLRVSTVLAVKDNIVKNLKVGLTPIKPQSATSQEWSAYSPDTLIERYGAPSKVNFALDWGPQSFFEMDIYFDEFDLIVQYIVYGFVEETYPRICPLTAPFEHISLWMGKNPRYPPHDIVLLEEATTLTLEEFSELMTRSPNKACFTLKEEAFR